MKSNIKLILGSLILASCSLKETQKSLIKTSTISKKTNPAKKFKKNSKQTKYSNTKPIKSKAVTQFRNKSNI